MLENLEFDGVRGPVARSVIADRRRRCLERQLELAAAGVVDQALVVEVLWLIRRLTFRRKRGG